MNLSVENLSKVFINDGNVHTVLSGVNFTVQEGQFVTLLGPSGCGKTTLLTIIAGFQSATEGSVLLNGQQVSTPGPDRGFVFQNYALFPWMTVRENILYPMKRRKMPRQQREQRLQELLTMAQLEGKEGLYPQQLSGGMKQRTAFIRALAGSPEVLLMDEPLGAVDFQMRQILQEELESIWLKDQTTVLMVTHDVDEAIYLSDRVIVMSAQQGNILEDLAIKLHRPRNRNGEKYIKYKVHLMNLLKKALHKEPEAPGKELELCLA
ncbi:Bicarbonate transport ATP-binding protein CmpD [Sporotomaculum syntrophicum]|uniref:Bicarbonate transport ATP-binding protein CmpD n=1 Tax=Sporotomaculum syntrophicum TaxID=182264 RepID=A0A9D3AX96_9FIRM|nr:ABC transporter ATP-binding protein SaoA [Sporotomaculum syntrophicum]KAF1084176.1 Bicarbonate transport ATP-binding protein CmpD [Sporotomaculum syntrophicum]